MSNENNQMANVSQALLGANDKGRVSYEVNGETVNLSFQIVRNFITRGCKDVSDAECIMFISLCKANKLNPFVGDAWLVKYDSKTPAQMVTARDAFMKRAETRDTYEGYQSGVIVIRNNKVEEQEGEFFLPSDQLVGGWAKVYRSDRKFPIVSRVRMQEYNTNKSTWAGKPATMIQKVAEAHAFRKAFPVDMSGLYTPEEMPDVQEQRPAPSTTEANKALAEFQDAPAPEQGPDREAEFTPDPEPAEEAPIVTDAPAEPEPVPAQAAQAADNNEESLFQL